MKVFRNVLAAAVAALIASVIVVMAANPKGFVADVCSAPNGSQSVICLNDANGAEVPFVSYNTATHQIMVAVPSSFTHVGTTAALQTFTFPVLPSLIHRDGYYAAGDAPATDYLHSSAACALNAGAGDGGSQLPAADGNCWLAVLPPTVDPRVFGAKCDVDTNPTPTDDSAAINKALNVASVLIPNAGCRTAATILNQPSRTLSGTVFAATEPPSGSRIVCDLGVSPCVQNVMDYAGSTTAGGQNTRNLSITRAAGTIPDGSICFLNLAAKSYTENVDCNGHFDGFVWRGAGAYGHVNFASDLVTCNINGDDMVMDSEAELHVSKPRFGCNGTRNTKHYSYAKFTGGGSGPSTFWMDNAQFNDYRLPTCVIDWTGNTGSNFNEYRFTTLHVEITGQGTTGPHYVFCGDSTVSNVANVTLRDSTILDNNGTSIAFNPAFSSTTVPGDWRLGGNYWTGFGATGWTLAPAAAFGLRMDGDIFNGPVVNVTGPGVGYSLVDMNFTSYNGVKISGAFGPGYYPHFGGVANSVVNTATSPVELDFPGQSLTDTSSALGLSFGSTPATLAGKLAKWTLRGSQITYSFYFQISSLNGATGSPVLTGLPFGVAGSPGKPGLMNCGNGYSGAASALFSLSVAGTTTAQIGQYSTIGFNGASLTQVNLPPGAVCYGSIDYSIQ